jgi:hypothetical protein
MHAMTHSTRLTAAMIGLVLLAAPALALLAYRNVETSILLAGLAAILGVVVATVLMADALTRPLVEMADAVTTLARARTAELASEAQHANDAQYANVVALETYSQRKRALAAGAEPGGTRAPERRKYQAGQTPGQAIGSTIDFVIPSDRREQHP